MKKRIRRRLINVVVAFSLVITMFTGTSNVIAQNDTIINHMPYSGWAEETGFKYNLVFMDKPQRGLFRWEVTNILYNVAGIEEEKKPIIRNNDLTDLAGLPDKTLGRIVKCYTMGLINGYEDKTFKPYNLVNRAEFVTLFDNFNLLQNTNQNEQLYYEDITNHWAKTSIYKAASQNLVKGKGGNIFAPDDQITIEESLVILDRLVESKRLSKDELVKSMIDTFNARIYSENERYLIEELSSGIMKAQQDMEIISIGIPEYDYTKIDEYVTVEDVLICMYYFMEGMDKRLPTNIETRRDILKNGFQMTRIYEKLITDTNNKKFDSYVNIGEILSSFCTIILKTDGQASFSNMSSMKEEEKIFINKAVSRGLIKDSTEEFPINSYIKKGVFNKLIMRFSEISSIKKVFLYFILANRTEEGYIDFNRAQWPSNYGQYPFIYRPLDNSVYEMISPFQKRTGYISARDSFNRIKSDYISMYNKAKKYFDIVLNLDYNTINTEDFYKRMSDLIQHRYNINDFERYVQYVKDNQIVVKGTSEPCMPILYFDGFAYRLRVKIDFTIENATTNKNILFGDSYILNREIVYTNKQYSMYVDLEYDVNLNGFHNPTINAIIDIQTMFPEGGHNNTL